MKKSIKIGWFTVVAFALMFVLSCEKDKGPIYIPPGPPVPPCVYVVVEIATDDFGSETTWELREATTGNLFLSGGPYASDSSFIDSVCVPAADSVCFTIFDSNGNGICCANDTGFYQVTVKGASVAFGSAFGTSESTCFKVSETPVYTVSFFQDVQPIFEKGSPSCVNCHPPSGYLSLTAFESYNQLVNVTADAYAPAIRVLPGDTTNSVLWSKITNVGGIFGIGMPPPNGGLAPEDIETIGTWIMEGAPNN